jgi:uncharacterized protein YggE
MERVEVTVRGEHTAFLAPERATVHATVHCEAPSADAAYAATADSARRLVDGITALHHPDAGPVTWWSSDQVRTWAQRPWNNQGKQLPVVHHAQVSLQVKFRDLARLGHWLGEVADVRGLSIEHVEWTLTAARQRSVLAEVRTAAVRDAHAKAQAYADALEAGPVHVVAIADSGMLGEGLATHGASPAAFSRAAKVGGGEVELVPQDVSVHAEVDARFATG